MQMWPQQWSPLDADLAAILVLLLFMPSSRLYAALTTNCRNLIKVPQK